MIDFKRRWPILVSLFICAVLVATLWRFQNKIPSNPLMTDQIIQDKAGFSRLVKNSSEIHRIWNEGEDSREWINIKKQCLDYYHLNHEFDQSLMRCQPMLIQCLALFNKKNDYHLVKPDQSPGGKKLYRFLTKSNTSHLGIKNPGFLFTIEDNQTHQQLHLFLENNCQEVFLENRAYAYGEELKGKAATGVVDYRFDNFGQNIYIDRHLVTNREVNEWIDAVPNEVTAGIVKKDGDALFMPATNLPLSQMENFCSFSGKQLLLAHYFDAATFLPMDLAETLPPKNNRSPYYWGKKQSDFKTDCGLIFAEECLQSHKYHLNSVGVSWAGLTDTMGGVFEAFRNPIDPESNLKASSYYFNFNSSWHRLGLRAGWDGEGFDTRHFNFKGIAPEKLIENFEVGFRCMRESK